jgi:hypothetical protein
LRELAVVNGVGAGHELRWLRAKLINYWRWSNTTRRWELAMRWLLISYWRCQILHGGGRGSQVGGDLAVARWVTTSVYIHTCYENEFPLPLLSAFSRTPPGRKSPLRSKTTPKRQNQPFSNSPPRTHHFKI